MRLFFVKGMLDIVHMAIRRRGGTEAFPPKFWRTVCCKLYTVEGGGGVRGAVYTRKCAHGCIGVLLFRIFYRLFEQTAWVGQTVFPVLFC